MLNIIHGADFHLDSPFSGLSPEQAARRRGEQRELLARLGAAARERGADLVLLAGDLLDGGETYRETVQALSAALGEMPCPVFIAPGNHDYYSPRSLYAALDWPDNVHIFTGDAIQGVPVPELNCVVYGRAFRAPREARRPLEGFSAPRDGRLHLMVLHGEVDGAGDYGPIPREDIAASGLDYLALGHIHRGQGPSLAGGTYWAYPGCPEGRGFDETGEKGVLFLQVDRGLCRGELIPLGGRRYHVLSVDVTGQTDLAAAVAAALPAGAERDVFRVLLTGERGAEGLDLDRLARALAPRCYGLTLYDHTRVRRDLWERMEEDTLTGLFLRQMAARCKQDPDNETLQQAVRFGLAALEQGEDIAP